MLNPWGMSAEEFEAFEAWVSGQEAGELAEARIDPSRIFTHDRPGPISPGAGGLPGDLDAFDDADQADDQAETFEPSPADRAWAAEHLWN